MSIEHSAIVDPNQHEPKGAASASAGQTYVSDGAGSGSFESPAYAEMKVSTNATAFTPVAADIAQYKKLINTGWSAGLALGATVNADTTNDDITITNAGTYKIDFWCAFSTSASTGTTFAAKFGLDAALDPRLLQVQKNGTGSDVLTMSASGLITVTAGQKVSIHIASSAATALTVTNAGLSLHRLGVQQYA